MPTIEEVIEQVNLVEECPPGQEWSDELGECVNIEEPIPFQMPEEAGEPITVADDPEVIKEEIKEQVKEHNQPKEWGIFESVIAINAEDKVNAFNNSWSSKGITFEQGDDVAEKVSMEKGTALFNKLVVDDPTINKELIPQTAALLQPEFDAKILELRKKYNGTTSEEWVKAEEEYNKFYNDKMMDTLVQNPKYKRILNAYETVVGNEIEAEFRAQKRFQLGLEDNADMSEGWKKFKKNLNRSWIGMGLLLQKDSNVFNEEINNIKSKLESGEIKEDDIVDYDIKYGNIEGRIDPSTGFKRTMQGVVNIETGEKISDAEAKKLKKVISKKSGTVKEALDYLEGRIAKKDEGILRRIGKIENINKDLEFFKKAEIFDEDGLTFDEFQMMIAEQIPQLALSLLPYGIGVMGQEAGGNYVDNLYAIARKEFGLGENETPTKEQLLQIIAEGKDAKGIALVSGIISGQLERLGAKKVLAASLGGTKVMGSLLRGEFKQALRGAKITTVEAIKSGMWEGVTETGQTSVSQIGETITGGQNSFNFQEILESAGQGILLGTVFPLGGGIARQSMTEFQNTAAIVAGKFDREATENYFKKIETSIKKDGRLTEETRRQRLVALGNVRSANMKVPKNMGGKGKTDAIKLLVKQQQIKNEYEGVDSNLIPEGVKAESKTIGDKLKALAVKDYREVRLEKARIAREEDTRSAKVIAKDLGFGFEGNLSPKQLKEIAGKNFDENTLGFIKKGIIYLNQAALKASNAVKTSSHELLHGIVMNAVGTKITQQGMKNWMQDNLSKKQRDQVEILLELGGYNKMKIGNKAYLDVRPDEYITQIYEAGIIEQPGMFEKVKVLVQDILNNMSKALGFEGNFNFATKDDLTEFLREYQTSIKEGKLSEKLKASKFFKPGKKGQAFSQDTTNDTLVTEINRIQAVPKDARSNADNNLLGFAVDQIVENNWPVIAGRIGYENWGAKGISIQSVKTALQEQILGIAEGRTGQKGGKTKLFEDFDAGKGVVTTRLGSIAGLRKGEILRRAKELDAKPVEDTESLDIEKAKQIADTSTQPAPKPSTKKTVKRTVNPTKVLPQNDPKVKSFLDETQIAVEAMSDQDLLDMRL